MKKLQKQELTTKQRVDLLEIIDIWNNGNEGTAFIDYRLTKLEKDCNKAPCYFCGVITPKNKLLDDGDDRSICWKCNRMVK